MPQFRLGCQPSHRISKRNGISRWHQQSGFSRLNRLRDASLARTNDRTSLRHRFGDHARQPFGVPVWCHHAGNQQRPCLGHAVRHRLGWKPAREFDQTGIARNGFQNRPLRTLPDANDANGGAAGVQMTNCGGQYLNPLLRHEAAHKQEPSGIGRRRSRAVRQFYADWQHGQLGFWHVASQSDLRHCLRYTNEAAGSRDNRRPAPRLHRIPPVAGLAHVAAMQRHDESFPKPLGKWQGQSATARKLGMDDTSSHTNIQTWQPSEMAEQQTLSRTSDAPVAYPQNAPSKRGGIRQHLAANPDRLQPCEPKILTAQELDLGWRADTIAIDQQRKTKSLVHTCFRKQCDAHICIDCLAVAGSRTPASLRVTRAKPTLSGMAWLAALPDRGVIELSGEDRITFLQGLVSNDVAQAEPGNAVWTALLTPQGKYLADFFIFAEPDRLLLDCERAQIPSLIQRLSRFRLRSKVMLRSAEEFCVYAAWDGAPAANAISAPDPRLPAAGSRLLSAAPLPTTALALDWDRHRLALGLPDGTRDLEPEKTVLLEAGFDELHGVSWTKGCYLGQELTARTKYRGLVKRRLVPVAISGDLPPPGTPVTRNGIEVGDMRSGRDQTGLAVLRIEALHETLVCNGAILTPNIPAWMSLPEATA